MILHFIFVIKDSDLDKRNQEFEYIKRMAIFYKKWIKEKFSLDFDVKCDQMITKPRRIFQRLDIHSLAQDHKKRDHNTYHFYLCHFRPLWTDCTCEGYHAENFGMIKWVTPDDPNDTIFLAEKNCVVVSHELCHELLRQTKYQRYIEDVHDVWTQHYFNNLPFENYDKNCEKTSEEPFFQTIDTSSFVLKKINTL